jgi:hypothetical protein
MFDFDDFDDDDFFTAIWYYSRKRAIRPSKRRSTANSPGKDFGPESTRGPRGGFNQKSVPNRRK